MICVSTTGWTDNANPPSGNTPALPAEAHPITALESGPGALNLHLFTSTLTQACRFAGPSMAHDAQLAAAAAVQPSMLPYVYQATFWVAA